MNKNTRTQFTKLNYTTLSAHTLCVSVKIFFFLEAFKDMPNGLHNLTLKHQQAVFI